MIIINIKENESIDKALKRFKKKFDKTGAVRELRARQAFTKPSVKRREQVIKAAYKQKLQEQFMKELHRHLSYIQSTSRSAGAFFCSLRNPSPFF